MTEWRSRMRQRSYAAIKLLQFILFICARTCNGQVAALGCKSGNVRYAGSSLPLLMGGVVESCKEGCQPRSDEWSQACMLSSNSNRLKSPTVRKCSASQTQAVVAQLLKDGHRAMLVFTPCELHQYLKGRTLWLIGDSLMQNYYFALRCFMLDFWDHSLGECQVSQYSHIERAVYHAADTNISSPLGSRVITDVPRCLWLRAGGRICWLHSVRGEEIADPDLESPGLLQTLQRTAAEPEDIFYVNFGRWHFSNCRGLQAEPYTQALWNLGKLYERTKDEFPNLLFKVSAHDHTACRNVARFEQVDACLPAEEGGYSLETGRRVMKVAETILGNFGVPVVNTYNETVKLHDGHITDRPIWGREMDCLHYCSPGVPEFEMWSMYKALRMYGIKPLATAAPAPQAPAPGGSHRRRQARRHAAGGVGEEPAPSEAADQDDDGADDDLQDLLVEFGPVRGGSSSSSRTNTDISSSSSSTIDNGVSTAGFGDSLEDLIGWVGKNPPRRTPPQNPTPKPRPPPRDPAPQCVPVTAKEPPPGWSYYYDRLLRKERPKRSAQLSAATGAAAQEEAMEAAELEADVLGTCTGDEF